METRPRRPFQTNDLTPALATYRLFESDLGIEYMLQDTVEVNPATNIIHHGNRPS